MNTRDHNVKGNSEDYFFEEIFNNDIKKFIGKKNKHQNLR